jgi:hypothetical protein
MKKSSTLVIASALLVTLTTAIAPATTFAASSKATVKPTVKSSAKPATKPTGLTNPAPAAGQGASGGFGARGGGMFAELTDANRACLTKNGFTIPLRPTDAPTARPTFSPGARPSFSPGQGGANGGGRGFGGGNFDPAAMQKAFAACGITAPQFGNGAGQPIAKPLVTPKGKTPIKAAATPVNPKQATFIKCMTAAGIKNSGAALAYDQSDPDTALTLIKCQKSSGFTLPKK